MNETDLIEITLKAGEWNAVIAMMAEQPFRVSAPLIQKIQQQCVSADAGAERPSLNGAGAQHAG